MHRRVSCVVLAALAALCAASSASVGPDGSTQPQCDCEGLQAIIKHVSDRYAALETECTENVVKAMNLVTKTEDCCSNLNSWQAAAEASDDSLDKCLSAYREEFLSVQELKREVEALKGKLEQQEAKTRAAQDQADECRDGVLRAAQAKAA